jgi:predicted KAP-like P-loop ATPase
MDGYALVVSRVESSVSGLSSDQPIREPDEDVLGRGPLVEILKDEIRAAPTSDGFVMALTAPWGEGKTSILNLIARGMGDEAVVIRFNPWLFSDTEALVVRFFGELGAQVQKDQSLRRVGKQLLSYGQTVAPLGTLLLGPAANAAGQSLAALAALGTRSAMDERERLKEALVQRERRLLVLIDDIDRLHQDEILDVLRLVKLVGDLPYVTYLLAFDRPYVESALGKERQADGRSYREKVSQVSYDLPAIRPSEIEAVLLEKLNGVLAQLDHLPVNQDRWSEMWGKGIAPFFRNLRDVARYASGVSTRVRLLGREVALEDILGLEALRVFEPQVHQLLPNVVEPLTKQRTDLFVNEEVAKERDREQIDHLVTTASEARRERVKTLLGLLFPQAVESLFAGSGHISDEWRASRRVAYAPAFRAYLHATIDPGSASYTTVMESIEAFGEPDKLRALFEGLGDAELQDLVERFPDFKSRIDPSSVPAGVSELLRLQHRLSNEWDGLKPARRSFSSGPYCKPWSACRRARREKPLFGTPMTLPRRTLNGIPS